MITASGSKRKPSLIEECEATGELMLPEYAHATVLEDGTVYYHWYATELNHPECDACTQGTCIQRVETDTRSRLHWWVHDCRDELS